MSGLKSDNVIHGAVFSAQTTNTEIKDCLIELNNGVSANTNDSGLLIERGSTGNNVFLGWDESADKVVVATTTATATSTGNLTLSPAEFVASSLLHTSLVVGRDTDNWIDFATDNNIVFRAGNADQVKLLDGEFKPVTDSDVDLGSNALRWKDAYVDSCTITGNAIVGNTIELGHATDTTISRTGSGAIAVEGTAVLLAGAQTGITSILATDLKIGEDDQTKIDFEDANTINLYTNSTKTLSLHDGGDLKLLTDGASAFFGASSEIELRHVADNGLILKHAASADDKYPIFTLQAGDDNIAVNDKLGVINFQAPDEGAGTDAILVAAGIEAVSEGDFAADNNATALVFKTGASEAAAEKVRITSAGKVGIGNAAPNVGAVLHIGDSSETAKQIIRIENDNAHAEIGVAGGGGDVLPTSAAGDLVISMESAKDILSGSVRISTRPPPLCKSLAIRLR